MSAVVPLSEDVVGPLAVLAAVSVVAVLAAVSLVAVLAVESVVAVLVARFVAAVLVARFVAVVLVAGSVVAVVAAGSVAALLAVGSVTAVLVAGSVAAEHVSAPAEGESRMSPAALDGCPPGKRLGTVAAAVDVPAVVQVAVQVAVFTAVQVGVEVDRRFDTGPLVGGGMSLPSLRGTLAALMVGALHDPAVAGTTVSGDVVAEVLGWDLESLALGEGRWGRARLLGQVMRWRHPPVYRPLVDLSTMEERHIFVTYRLGRTTIQELCAQLEPELVSAIRHPTRIPPLVQVLSVPHFLASGSCQTTVAIASGMSQEMFSNVLSIVLSALLKHIRSYIVLPQVEDLPTVKVDFYALGHIPNIIGAIDGTHVALVTPAGVNRCTET
ncbi:hypothetical protein NDU88_005758 [Pleurodeles waltl]|uniref:Nuclease HARBI1 n=1 Tax=Pleurodeles waltl TaxID=8319 RepID=A0AAV7PPH0_PLEWA|nr:hypothetical protein NDU88_005758 [Pleurodeles waltl]